MHKEEKGMARYWWFLALLLVVGGIYVSIMVMGPYFHYWMMLDTVSETARHFAKVKPRNDDEIIQKILDEARNQELPIDRDNVTYIERDGRLYLAAEWSDTIVFPYYSHTFNFKAEANEQLLR
jgi:hypothetical protein